MVEAMAALGRGEGMEGTGDRRPPNEGVDAGIAALARGEGMEGMGDRGPPNEGVAAGIAALGRGERTGNRGPPNKGVDAGIAALARGEGMEIGAPQPRGWLRSFRSKEGASHRDSAVAIPQVAASLIYRV